ncbi:polysaccharide pyruvyl transferase CsaB [Ruminiclostridium cellulolyticum]|uniref:Polysaccharide pyruvyl transferase n=1 Tax=Ruminiclostridium cellulolyticum (strain ATCC 35319 / DSM 5812 / JCM 6584 / H10) TaxID=394503 RepID=B8I877_RUMCH|nr:polysaccharide pyruvyl transferase CsaB [Ruminiclostridium cellulolyticum]ACL77177.1 polysaccharide pyruvyl transferase [Ruminiclostridium cellulolyticum H10]
MKVLHLIGGGDVGGAKVHVLSLVKELTARIDVTLLSLRPGAFADEARAMGIDVKVIKSSNIIKDIRHAIGFVKNNNFDIIHSHGAKANIFAYAIKKACNIPVVTTMHSDYKLDYLQSLPKRLSIGLFNSGVLHSLDYYIVVTSAFRKMLIERGFDTNSIYTILNGIDFDKKLKDYSREEFALKYGIQLDKNDILVGIAARLTPVKGISTLLEAAKLVVEKNPKVKFLIGGDGEDYKSLTARCHQLGLENNVFFLGWLNDPYELMSIIDISVLTSISEGFPYSILEGARFSKATVSSRVGGIPDLIDSSENGYLFEPLDYSTLAEYLLELSLDHEKRKEFGRRIYEKAYKNFSLDAMCKTQLAIYSQIQKNILNEAKGKKYDVIVSGYYGFGNIGDDAMLRSIVDNLKEQRPGISILALSRNPVETARNYGVSAINRKNVFKVYWSMKKAKLFIYGGGNIIQDSTSSRSLMFYLGTAWLAKKLKLKIMFYANGIGPINKPRNIEHSRKILNMADVITVRERFSLNELKKMGITGPKIALTADAAFAVNINQAELNDSRNFAGLSLDKSYAGFSVRRCPGSEEHQHVKYEQAIAEAADYVFTKYGLEPVFIPMEYDVDICTIKNIISKMKTKNHTISNNRTILETFSVIHKMDIMVSMRLHALIFAAYLKIPFIGISYQPKVDGFLEYINQPSAGNVKEISFERLRSKIDNVLQNREPIKAVLESSVENLICKARENSGYAIELISE